MKDDIEPEVHQRTSKAPSRRFHLLHILLTFCFLLAFLVLFASICIRAGIIGHRNLGAFSIDSHYNATSSAQDPFQLIHIQASDDSIRATFISFGATLIELWVKDRNGEWTDVVTGYDNVTYQAYDPIHPYFGSQVGRYANRIKGGTFLMDGKRYNTSKNENDINTLHGGFTGYDARIHTIQHQNSTSVVFSLHDKDGNQGFPGEVISYTEYHLGKDGAFNIQMRAKVIKGKSPIMLSSHVYWALHGYKGHNDTILHHTLHLPRANRYINTDSSLIPTGSAPNGKDTPFDFQVAREFSERFNQTSDVCGIGCTGWDSCFIMDLHNRHDTVLTMTSPETGIQMSVKTNQDAIQIYTCNGINGPKGGIPRKKSHGGDGTKKKVYENYSCVVIEMEDYIDAINNPQWRRYQFYDEKRSYEWQAEYSFSTVK